MKKKEEEEEDLEKEDEEEEELDMMMMLKKKVMQTRACSKPTVSLQGSIEESEVNIVSVFCLKLANSQLACLEVSFNEPCNSEA
ncbi:hypothetical protein T11_5941 [Trichinella zimbabwensis]|uniref:Uncharacterized protein n=1 Tax=Trichinella zimbabwensis TaxID=268475 RepID=A0A0V1HIL1_9BILA|nr:hypothetical protein T11_5941 [Trichinella zimbabwensis]